MSANSVTGGFGIAMDPVSVVLKAVSLLTIALLLVVGSGNTGALWSSRLAPTMAPAVLERSESATVILNGGVEVDGCGKAVVVPGCTRLDRVESERDQHPEFDQGLVLVEVESARLVPQLERRVAQLDPGTQRKASG